MLKEIQWYREFGWKELHQDFANLQPSLQLFIPAPIFQIKAPSTDLCAHACMGVSPSNQSQITGQRACVCVLPATGASKGVRMYVGA